MSVALLSVFVLALFAPFLNRLWPKGMGFITAVFAWGLVSYFSWRFAMEGFGEGIRESLVWIPALGLSLQWRLDGLSMLFTALIAGIGGFILLYAGAYLREHPERGRFFAYLLFFMGAMLGVVWSENLISLFVFWELTSLSSYLLIGFEHHREQARSAALQALLVTGLGGLALLAGFLLIGKTAGTFSLQALLAQPNIIRGQDLYLPILLLVFWGALSKSAQFPFHFWLPRAMEAPTPASAYLHSATMVKAGIYLLARMHPLLGHSFEFSAVLGVSGGITLLLGAVMATQALDLKQVLAYTTLSALGVLTLLLGVGSEAALGTALLYLVAHALYKASLFLVVGAVDHGTGTRYLDRLGGLRRLLPLSATAAGLSALSMAGMPPLLGFLAKENLYGALFSQPWVLSLLVFASLLMVVAALWVGWSPFWGRNPLSSQDEMPHHAHEDFLLAFSPLFLAVSSLLLGFVAIPYLEPLLLEAGRAMHLQGVSLSLGLWHGWNKIFLLSMGTLLGGYVLFLAREYWIAPLRRGVQAWRWGPAFFYERIMAAIVRIAALQTRFLQSGYLRYYITTILLVTLIWLSYPVFLELKVDHTFHFMPVSFFEVVLSILILSGAYSVVRARSRLVAVIALGVVGYGTALFYILYGAPDLAMTQFLVETLTVLLFVFVLYRLPAFRHFSGRGAKFRDAVVASLAGGTLSLLLLLTNRVESSPELKNFFAEHSYAVAHGRNIVNVILVDFRALDTLGEITVLVLGALGVYALLKIFPEKKEPS